ncbi:MAG TPA: formate dehydrogenase accessory sulfurtransferase FdhD, partial [Planctomicrobium sp.]|nr:formate dehydrogenase accessory sulfurtransferase FdhD [Planctomicrobium sp.]
MSQSADELSRSSSPFRPVVIQRVDRAESQSLADLLAVEEPMEIRLSYVRQKRRRQRTVAVTMRTPGHDRELAVGFLLTEGIIQSPRDVLAVYSCRNGNRVRVHLRDEVVVNFDRLRRHFYTSSSCGVCGKTSLDAVQSCVRLSLPADSPQVSADVIHSLPAKLRAAQAVFEQTGGLHASALFSPSGELLSLREDVGRHNALDKLIGQQLLMKRFPLADCILLVSGRASFELIQKAVMAGIPILAA